MEGTLFIFDDVSGKFIYAYKQIQENFLYINTILSAKRKKYVYLPCSFLRKWFIDYVEEYIRNEE